MMLATKNITNRLKPVSRFFDADRWHKRPHISFLEGLPVELLQSIASYLPRSAAASFALIYIVTSLFAMLWDVSNYWHHLRPQPLEYEIFLGFLEKKIMNGHWLGDIFHLKSKFNPIV